MSNPFKPGHDPRRNTTGRPRGRIREFRKLLGQLTGDGREVAERLLSILRDPDASSREVIDASSLLLAYLLGRPEVAVDASVDVTAVGAAQVDIRALAARLPQELVQRVVSELDGPDGGALLLPAAAEDQDE